VGLFRRRRETLNEQLLREAGLDLSQLPGTVSAAREPEPEPAFESPPALSPPDLHGMRVGPKEWDTTVTLTASGLTGDEIRFTTLPDGDLIVDEQEGDANVSELADAVETRLQPPYKAVAKRQDGDLWAIGAKRIDVARIEFSEGDELELSRKDSWEDFRVDGEPTDLAAPGALRQLGERRGTDFFAKAERIDGSLWEVRVTAL
jgi:hypothetical protein